MYVSRLEEELKEERTAREKLQAEVQELHTMLKTLMANRGAEA